MKNSTNDRRAKRAAKFFTIVLRFYFSRTVFLVCFYDFRIFLKNLGGGHVPPGSPHAKSQCMSKPWVQTIFFERFCYRMSSFCFFDSFYIVISHYRIFFSDWSSRTLSRNKRYIRIKLSYENRRLYTGTFLRTWSSLRLLNYISSIQRNHGSHSSMFDGQEWSTSVTFCLHFLCFLFFQICRFQLTSDKHKFEKKEHYILL